MATIVRFPASAWTRTPVRIGRTSSREAARATRSIVSASGAAGSVAASPSTSGRRGKSSAGSVFRWNRASPAVSSTSRCSVRSSSDTSPGGRLRATSTRSRPGSRTVPSRSIWTSDRVSAIPISMSVARSVERAVLGDEEDAAERGEGRACGDGPAGVLEGGDEGVAWSCEFHRGSLIFLPGSDVSEALKVVEIYRFARRDAGTGCGSSLWTRRVGVGRGVTRTLRAPRAFPGLRGRCGYHSRRSEPGSFRWATTLRECRTVE